MSARIILLANGQSTLFNQFAIESFLNRHGIRHSSTTVLIIFVQNPESKILNPSRPACQVAGFTLGYAGLDYVTIRGAGHMVPQLKPAEALHMFSTWLEGGRL